MISEAVIANPYDICRASAIAPTKLGVEKLRAMRKPAPMLGTSELLERLRSKGIRNIDVAKALGLPDSRVPEIYSGKRALKLDEAAKLVDAFDLEETSPPINPLTIPVARLLVLHVAQTLGAPMKSDSPLVGELAEDLKAFSAFAADQQVRDSVQATAGFLQGMRIRRTDRVAPPPSRRPLHEV